jgi:hypothetical protein
MELILFSLFIGISALIITLGLYRTEHSEFVLIGFFFLFLLSFTLINGNLEYQTGESSLERYFYQPDNITLVAVELNTTYTYSTFSDETELFNTNRAGYWLAVISGLGFAITLFSFKRMRWSQQ